MLSTRSLIALLLPFCISVQAFGAIHLEVIVNGVEGEIKDNIISYLSIEQQKTHPNLNEARILRLHHKAIGEIKKALQPFGYYEPHINSDLAHDKDEWTVTYNIDVGRPVLVSAVDIQITGEGAHDSAFQQLVDHFPLRKGDVLMHARYERGRDAFLQMTSERGYFDSHLLKHEIIVRPETYSASITIHIETGQRYSFGKFTFKQQTLNEKLLRRYMIISPGDPYSTDKLLEFQNTLTDSGYFSQVDVRGNRDAIQDHEIPIIVTLEPRYKYLYSFGIGYGTDTGPRGTLGWENRRVNKSGHRIETELQASEITNSITARYKIPIRDPRTDYVALTTEWVQNDPRTSSSETLLLGIGRTTSPHPNWLETVYFNYQSEDFIIGDDEGHTTLFLPGITWSRIKADDRILTTHGSRLWLDFKTGFGHETNLVQARANGKIVRSAGENARILLRGDIAATDTTDFDELPASLRFFTGGDHSVRGYAYESLGPTDSNGVVIGGKDLLVGSIELEHKIAGNWSGALFYDIGNAVNDFSEDLKRGAGLGVRWKTIIGPIRLDYAWALSYPGDPWRIHLTIGPDL